MRGIILREAFIDVVSGKGKGKREREKERGEGVSVALIVSKQSTREREILFNCVRRIPG